MNERALALLAFRLLALGLISIGLAELARIPAWSLDPRMAREVRLFGLVDLMAAPSAKLLAGCAVWMASRALALRTFPDSASGALSPTWGAEPLLVVGLALIGVAQVVDAVPLLVNSLTLYKLSRSSVDLDARWWDGLAKAKVAMGCVELLFGVILMGTPVRVAKVLLGVKDPEGA